MRQPHEEILALAAQIVSAHVGNNPTHAGALPALIRQVYDALSTIDPGEASTSRANGTGKQTVFQDHLVCLEDGLTMKMLKRHLITVHGLTPDQYREKWGLPPDYPMVAADYAKLRSSLAKQSGLGRRPDAVAKRGRPPLNR